MKDYQFTFLNGVSMIVHHCGNEQEALERSNYCGYFERDAMPDHSVVELENK